MGAERVPDETILERFAKKDMVAAHQELDRRGAPKTKLVMKRSGDGQQAITLGLAERLRSLPWAERVPSQPERELPIPTMADAAEMLWIVLANVSGGDWKLQSQEWQDAAARWRDYYFMAITVNAVEAAGVPSPQQEIQCRHCTEDIRWIDGEWMDRETHPTCALFDGEQRHEPPSAVNQHPIEAGVPSPRSIPYQSCHCPAKVVEDCPLEVDECQHRAESYAAEIASPPPPGWQPIESAPWDTEIWVADGRRTMTAIHRRAGNGFLARWQGPRADDFTFGGPDCWMPLPLPPEAP